MNTSALIRLWNVTQMHHGTSGARAAAGVLLGLYNGTRFPYDLTDLRVLDSANLRDALEVIQYDATRCQMEVHDWLNQLTGRRDFGARFEHLAWEYGAFKRGRCKKEHLDPRAAGSLVIKAPVMDHVNGDPTDNSPENLRVVHQAQGVSA